MPLVSVVMPVRNDAGPLVAAVRSVFAQTLTDWELLIGDDASDDATPDLLAAIEDPRVRVFRSAEPRGSGWHRNRLVREARGEFVAAMDADDIMVPERLACQVEALQRATDLDLVASGAYLLSAEGRPLALTHDWPLDPAGFRAIRAGYLIHPSVTGRRAWCRANPYDLNLWRGQDHELWARCYPALRARRLVQPLLFYRVGEVGSLASQRRGWWSAVRVYLRHGPTRVGVAGTLLLVLGTLAQLALTWLPQRLGLEPPGYFRRRRGLQAHQAQEALRLLDQVDRTPVPGWADLP